MHGTASGPFRLHSVRGGVGLVVVMAGLFLGGCTVTSFLGRQYTNFTAYYNKFHNATTAFEKGRASIEERERAIDRTQYVSVFLEPGDQVSEAPFDEAIQKSADVLREHPDSKWVDDALLLIGKSYFYQQSYVGAAQKFREVIALEGERAQEARFWLARTLVATGRYEAAAEVIRTGIEGQDGGAWTARLHLVRGQLLARQERWNEAVRALNRGLSGDPPDDVAARAAFLLGQVLETIGRPGPARAAYQKVQQYDPVYALDFAARLNDIELQGTHGDPARALDRLRDLETDEKNYEQRGEMAVVRARIYRAQGQYDRARRTLRNMLYGEEAPSGASRGRLHYDLARLYRDAFKDFSRAAAHFDTASTALGAASGRGDSESAHRMPTAPVDASAQADRYRDLADRARTVARLDSLLRLGRMSDRAFREYVAKLRRQRRAEQKAEADDEQSRARRLRPRSRGLSDRRREAAPAAETQSSDAGFLFYKDPARVQRGRRQFEQTWGDRPLVDNWRRQVALRSASPTASTDEQTGEESSAPAPAGTGPPGAPDGPSSGDTGLDLSAVPRDSASLAKMEDRRTVARYKLANSLFLAASRPDSAATWYRRILQENGDHPVAKRALYALAEAYRAQGDSTAARQTYDRLIDQYPETDLAARARRRLNRTERMPAHNRQAQADSAYARVYNRWQAGRRDSVLAPFLSVATRYPDTDAAPRALLAAGIAYWREAQRDSAEAPRQLLRRHVRALQPPDSARSDSLARSGSVESEAAERGAAATAPPADSAQARRREPGTEPVAARPAPERSPDSLRAGATDTTDGGPVRRSRSPDGAQAAIAGGASGGQDADSLRKSRTGDVYAPLDGLMTHLTERYPDAPQAKQARSILQLIEKRRAGARTDTVATDTTTDDRPETAPDAPARRDTTAADTAAVTEAREARSSRSPPDSSRVADSPSANRGKKAAADDRPPLPAPTGRRPSGQSARDAAPPDIDRERGGWTLLVGTFSRAQDASVRVADVGRRLGDQWAVELLKEVKDGTTQYRLVVGQFQTERAAVQAQGRVEEQIGEQPQVWALSEAGPRPRE